MNTLPSEQIQNLLWLGLKIIVSIGGLWFVFRQIDLSEIGSYLRQANAVWLLVALLFFILSKWIAAFRLLDFLIVIGLPLTPVYNLRLYLVGMFYNLFLPGGIGGDGYKVLVFRKQTSISTRRLVSTLLFDRLSGMFAVAVLLCMLFPWLQIQQAQVSFYQPFVLLLIPFGVLFFGWVARQFFPFVRAVLWKTTLYSFGVQVAQLFVIVCLLAALGKHTAWEAYIWVFLCSSVVVVLPITIGGVGLRELTFLYGAMYLELDETVAVVVSVLFYLTQMLVSLVGIVFVFYKKGVEEVRLQGDKK